MASAASALVALASEELRTAPGPAALELTRAIRARHGDVVRGVLFYGSCLRRLSAEGVLDFYVLVDSYRATYARRHLRGLNALLPPNVLWIEHPVEDAQAYRGSDGVLRSKYAVLTLEDFERLCDRRALDGRVWARFSQPAALVFARDEETRERVQRAVAEAAVTLVGRILPLLAEEPGAGSTVQRFRAAELFSRGFRETYSAELRSEAPETIASVVESDPARYERVTREVLRVMVARGRLRSAERDGEDWVVLHDPGDIARGRRAWSLRRRAQKALVVVALLKTSLTQDDWVSYAVFKLERHSGREIPLTDRQRRHPLIFGWPVIVRLLRDGTLR